MQYSRLGRVDIELMQLMLPTGRLTDRDLEGRADLIQAAQTLFRMGLLVYAEAAGERWGLIASRGMAKR